MEVEILPLGAFGMSDGPQWDPGSGRLSWVDISAGALHAWTPATGHRERMVFADALGSATPRAAGGWVCAVGGSLLIVEAMGARPVPWAPGLVPDRMRLNDAAADPRGRLWVGGIARTLKATDGLVLVVDADGSVAITLEGFALPNGIGFAPDGSEAYVVDTLRHVVDAIPLDSGTGLPLASGRRVAVRLDPSGGMPDGLAVDAGGDLWIARFRGGAIESYRPDGVPRRRIEVPAHQPAGIALGVGGGGDAIVTSALDLMPAGVRPGTADGALARVTLGVSAAPHRAYGA